MARPSGRRLGAASVILTCAASLVACGEPEARPRQIDEAPDLPPPADVLEASIRARAPSEAMLMIPADAVMRGHLDAGASRDLLVVLRAGLCYKVLGEGGDGVEDLDLVVHDPNGVLLQRDATEHAHPVIGVERALCPVEPGPYRVVVSARHGSGDYAVQVWVSQ